jgi:hypothetical protein
MANEIKPIVSAPEFMEIPCGKINEIAAALKPLLNITGQGSVKVTVSDSNIVISSTGGGGAGLPADYTFEEFTICDSGTPATRWWPTWLTNPEA